MSRAIRLWSERSAISRPAVEPLENRCLLSAVIPALAGASYLGQVHLGRLFATFPGNAVSTSANPDVKTVNLAITAENANGLLDGTVTIQDVGSFTLVGMVRADGELSGVIHSATAGTGQISAHVSASGDRLNGSLFDTAGANTERGGFHLTKSVAAVSGASGTSGAAVAIPSLVSGGSGPVVLGSYTGVARVHVPNALLAPASRTTGTSSSSVISAASGKQGVSIAITGETTDGLLQGAMDVQSMGGFNFVGIVSGRKYTLYFDGADGSGTSTGTVATGSYKMSGNIRDVFSSKAITGSYVGVNPAVTPPSSTGNGSGAGRTGNTSNGNTGFPPYLNTGPGGVNTTNGSTTNTPIGGTGAVGGAGGLLGGPGNGLDNGGTTGTTGGMTGSGGTSALGGTNTGVGSQTGAVPPIDTTGAAGGGGSAIGGTGVGAGAGSGSLNSGAGIGGTTGGITI